MRKAFALATTGDVATGAGLLLLRLIVSGSMFIKHGLEKVLNFSQMAQHFPDPIHIGPVPSLVIAMIADFICNLMIIIGLATRWAAAFSFCNLFVAWALVHHFAFAGKGPGADHGELIVVYMGAMLALIFAGAGRYSADYKLGQPRI